MFLQMRELTRKFGSTSSNILFPALATVPQLSDSLFDLHVGKRAKRHKGCRIAVRDTFRKGGRRH